MEGGGREGSRQVGTMATPNLSFQAMSTSSVDFSDLIWQRLRGAHIADMVVKMDRHLSSMRRRQSDDGQSSVLCPPQSSCRLPVTQTPCWFVSCDTHYQVTSKQTARIEVMADVIQIRYAKERSRILREY